jgi:predicted MFS family arabinose efflux permease
VAEELTRAGRGAGSGPTVRLGVLLTVAMVAGTTGQFGLGALGPFIRADLELTRGELGLLSFAYYAAVAALSLVAGRLLARSDDRSGLAAIFLLAAAGSGWLAVAPGYWPLYGGLAVAAAAAAISNPVTNRAIVPHPEAGAVLVSVKQAGVPVCIVLAGSLLPAAAHALGWRAAFLCCAAFALAALPLIRIVPGAPREGARDGRSRGGRPPPRTSTARLTAYSFCMGAGGATVTAYLALWGHERLGLGEATAGLLLSVVGVGGIAGRLLWATLTERAAAAGVTPPMVLAGLGVAAAVGTLGLLPAAGRGSAGVALAWGCALLLGLSSASWNALAMLLVISGTAAETVRASGRVLSGFYAGLAVTPPLYGAVVDRLGYTPGWLLTAAAFACSALVVAVRRPRSRRPDSGR